MNFIEKKRELEKICHDTILPLIDRDYVLYGLPYYTNVGDTLIWDGELELLKKSHHKCRGVCAWSSYPKTYLPEDVIILVTGGGYFGDLWRRGWQEVLDGIKPNINNRILIMPCSIFYENEETRKKDSEYLAKFKNLIILTRDQQSYDYAKEYFSNDVVLVPDMAFCMNEKHLLRNSKIKPNKEILLLSRNDKEKSTLHMPDMKCDIQDWLPMEEPMPGEERFLKLQAYCNYLGRISNNLKIKCSHYLYRTLYRTALTKAGICQLRSYKKIYTTRLHGMILGMMLGREIYFIDNSYGKIKAYFDTWLKDCDNVKPL